jgi:mono/diheme cytochrome c family protein
MSQVISRLVLGILIPILSTASTAVESAAVDFVRDVQPVFVERCIDCHGPETAKAGLRLDGSAAVTLGGDSGRVIVPHDSAASELMRRIRGDVPEDRMPPKGEPLSREEISAIAAWIDAGAVWPAEADSTEGTVSDHWAFHEPERPELPAVERKDWVRNPIDAFVLARLESEGLTPSPEADPIT